MKPKAITTPFAGTAPPMTMDEVVAMTIYAPTGTFRVDTIVRLEVAGYWHLSHKTKEKANYYPPGIVVKFRGDDVIFYGPAALAILDQLQKKKYFEDDQTETLDLLKTMCKQFDAMFDDEGILKSPQTP